MALMEKSAVPKFGSFKPKPKPSTEQDAPQQSKTREKDSSERRRRPEEADQRSRRDDEDRRSHDGRRRDRHRHSESRQLLDRSSIAQDEFEESNLFIVDRRGDRKNVEYGSLHRYSVPAYRRSGYGNVIGLSSTIKIDRNESTDKELSLTSSGRNGQNRLPRLLTSKRAKVSDRQFKFVTHHPDLPAEDTTAADYIKLRLVGKRKRGSESPMLDAPHVDYRSIEGNAKPSVQLDDEDATGATESDSDDFDQDLDLKSRQKSSELSKQAKSDPTNLDRWLSLAEHQAKLVRPSTDESSLTSSERAILAELRLAILEEATVHISRGRPDRDRLLHTTIGEGSYVWTKAKLKSKWADALAECSTSMLLWTGYLNFMQDDTAGFRYDAVYAAYLDCMKVISNKLATTSEIERHGICYAQMYVLVRFTIFVRDAGYNEFATALWQVLLELEYCMPHTFRHESLDAQLNATEEFWESEAPRIGEDGAKGWSRHVEEDNAVKRSRRQPNTAVATSGSGLTSFEIQETQLSHHLILPASAEDDDATVDPYRYIMFSDLRPILEYVCQGFPKESLLAGLLLYAGLPALPTVQSNDIGRLPSDDSHLEPNCGSSIEDVQAFCRRESTETLFDDAFAPFASRITVENPTARFVDRVLNTVCTNNTAHEVLAEYYLAFKLQLFPSEVAKTAKRVLKRQASSLRLYNAYALVEAKLGHFDKASQVWATALGMTKSPDGDTSDDAVLLWQSRLLARIRRGNDEQALSDLFLITDGKSTISIKDSGDATSFRIHCLQLTRMLEEGFDRSQLAGKIESTTAYANVLAWLTYLYEKTNIEETLQVYKKYTTRLERTEDFLALELLLQHKAALLKSHLERRRPYRPTFLRNEIGQALMLFPNNSIFLELHGTLASQDRLRALVQEQKILQSPSTVTQWIFALKEEVRRTSNDVAGSTANTIRATFTKALLSADSKVKHSQMLWSLWFRFEHDYASCRKQPFTKAKQVFFDGLRHLPWVKVFAIQGLLCLSNAALSMNEAQQVYETIFERGLRIRVEMDVL